MTTDVHSPDAVVYEPPPEPPPTVAAGVWVWMRTNLFKSVFDTLLTIAALVTLVVVVAGLLQWIVADANWFVVTKNLRLFMTGRFPADSVWRVERFILLLAFIVGFTIALLSRVRRSLMVALVIILALTFIVPALVDRFVPPAHSYLAAGDLSIVSGSVTEIPKPQVGFIGLAGEEITLRVANQFGSDEALAQVAGFADRAATAILNAAANRLEAQEEQANVQNELNNDLLTDSQRQQLTSELAGFQIPPSVSETFHLNQEPVSIKILDGQTLNILTEGVVQPGVSSFSYTLPADGWYILGKQMQGQSGSAALLETIGIYPVLTSNFSATDVRYLRMNDTYLTRAVRPQIDGKDAPILSITDNQYRGERPFSDFLKLHVGPFLQTLSQALLWIFLLTALGYLLCRLLQSNLPDSRLVARIAWAMWITWPIITALLLADVDSDRWGGLLLTFLLTAVGIVASFPIGVLLALGRRSRLPVVKWACIFFIELVRGVPLIAILFLAQLMLPMLNPALVNVDNVFRAMVGITLFSAAYLAENVRGGLQSIPYGQEEAARALGLNPFQTTFFITLPQALRAVIPALVGQFISLFKDTSLVAIVGLFDLTKVADSTIAQAEFIGLRKETYIFIAVIYFGFSYVMAHISRRIEAQGVGSTRRL